jgi:hypothetical protein
LAAIRHLFRQVSSQSSPPWGEAGLFSLWIGSHAGLFNENHENDDSESLDHETKAKIDPKKEPPSGGFKIFDVTQR